MASAGTVEQVSSSDKSSDGDDDNPLSSFIAVRPSVRVPAHLPVSPPERATAHPPVSPPVPAPAHLPVSPPQAEPLPVVPTRDFSDDEEDQTTVGELLSKAISTIGGTTDVSYYLVVSRRHMLVGWFHIQDIHSFFVLIFIECIILF